MTRPRRRWRCGLCAGTGWRARRTNTGQVLTHDEFRYWLPSLPPPHPDDEPRYRMTRCACAAAAQETRTA